MDGWFDWLIDWQVSLESCISLLCSPPFVLLYFRSYEQGAFAAKEGNDFKKVVELIDKAYKLHIENGTPDTAGNLLDRGGK